MESDPSANQASTPNSSSKSTSITGNVHVGSGDFVARDKHIHGDEVRGDKVQYIVGSLDDVPLSPEEMRSLLALYRQRLGGETRYVKLEGIPLPDEDLASRIPLQRVYIHIQALEQRQSQELCRAEGQAR